MLISIEVTDKLVPVLLFSHSISKPASPNRFSAGFYYPFPRAKGSTNTRPLFKEQTIRYNYLSQQLLSSTAFSNAYDTVSSTRSRLKACRSN